MVSGETAPERLGVRGRIQADPVLFVLVVLAFAAYSIFALVRWAHLENHAFDLGIFDQVVWHYSRLETPGSSVRGYDNIWGDHFSPILATLAPLYWISEDARMLLLSQALLLAAAAIPIYLFAREKVGRLAAYLLAAGYLLFWGVQSALAFDFHEVAFAPLILGCLLLSAEHRNWKAFFGLLILLLCVKEDQSILAVFIGLYVLTFRAWREGLATIAIGAVWYLLVVKALIPHHSPTGEHNYWAYDQFGEGPVDAVAYALTHPGEVARTFFDAPQKRVTIEFLVVPLLGLAFLSRSVILIAPLAAERFLSENAAYWNTGGHYTLAMAAILFIGAADGLANVLRFLPVALSSVWRPRLAVAAALMILALNVKYTTTFEESLADLGTRSFYTEPDYVKPAEAAIAAVPPGVSLITQDLVIARLTQRDLAVQIRPDTGMAEYLLVNAFGIDGERPTEHFDAVSRLLARATVTHDPVHYGGGWLAMRSRALPRLPRATSLAPMPADQARRIVALQTAWSEELANYGAKLLGCPAGPQEVACARRLGRAFSERHTALVDAIGETLPTLSVGCRQFALASVFYANSVAGALAGAREARIARDVAATQKRAADLQKLRATDAVGGVARFGQLCSPGP